MLNLGILFTHIPYFRQNLLQKQRHIFSCPGSMGATLLLLLLTHFEVYPVTMSQVLPSLDDFDNGLEGAGYLSAQVQIRHSIYFNT